MAKSFTKQTALPAKFVPLLKLLREDVGISGKSLALKLQVEPRRHFKVRLSVML